MPLRCSKDVKLRLKSTVGLFISTTLFLPMVWFCAPNSSAVLVLMNAGNERLAPRYVDKFRV